MPSIGREPLETQAQTEIDLTRRYFANQRCCLAAEHAHRPQRTDVSRRSGESSMVPDAFSVDKVNRRLAPLQRRRNEAAAGKK
jgi:hypothetical protein